MRRSTFRLRPALALAALALAANPLHAQDLGSIEFPASAAEAAQPSFVEGVKALHNFQFDEAAVAFRRTQQLDPDFALGYWGEAMSYNHPLWDEQDTSAARAALERLAPSLEARLARAGAAKERELIAAVEALFYGAEDKLARDLAYADKMAALHARWPEDHEIATFYALSLLGTVRPGDTGFRRQALAASLMLEVFGANANHPGAAHFIIHAFDDPDHAPLALPAARVYAEIAPASAHALHMPSHIFVQLGLWENVVESNVESYAAAVELNRRMGLPEGRSDFHALSWLAYGNLMLGRHDDAAANIELARQALERNPDSQAVLNGYLEMRARQIVETRSFEPIDLRPDGQGGFEAAVPEIAGTATRSNGAWLYAAGASAAELGNIEAAVAAETQLERIGRERQAEGDLQGARLHMIMSAELAAARAVAEGRPVEAVRHAEQASRLELESGAPSGPPTPIKPAPELLGEILLSVERPAEAAAAFEQSLLRTPKRRWSLLGLARAAEAAGDDERARSAYRELVSMPGAESTSDAVREARAFLQAGTR